MTTVFNSTIAKLDWFWTAWMSNDILLKGVGPVAVFAGAFLFSSISLEILTSQTWTEKYAISYPGSGTRAVALKKTRNSVPLSTQLFKSEYSVLYSMFGAAAFIGGVINYFLFKYVFKDAMVAYTTYPGWQQFLWHMLLTHLVDDFFLYWGHRIQHDIPYLWENFHKVHHSLETPTSFGTIYIHGNDATLQGSLPVILSWLIVRPHPLTMYAHFAFRIFENAVNHSGLDWLPLNILSLKVLPFRASVAHHDAHHRYSHYGKNAKNYGEFFWVWDWVFGTLRSSALTAAAPATAVANKKDRAKKE